MIFVDAGNDKVAIGTATATATLTVAGSAVAKTDTDTSNTGNVTLDFTANQNFVLTLTGNTTLVNPTTEKLVNQDLLHLFKTALAVRTVATRRPILSHQETQRLTYRVRSSMLLM